MHDILENSSHFLKVRPFSHFELDFVRQAIGLPGACCCGSMYARNVAGIAFNNRLDEIRPLAPEF